MDLAATPPPIEALILLPLNAGHTDNNTKKNNYAGHTCSGSGKSSTLCAVRTNCSLPCTGFEAQIQKETTDP